MSDTKSLYRFGPVTDGDASMKDLLGGKGANLAEMSKLGVPVPAGFTIPCPYSIEYHLGGQSLAYPLLLAKVSSALEWLASVSGGKVPLLSVRSGARVSMPGMMDTILNVGLTDDTLPYWIEKLGQRAALDSYRRLLQMYGSVAMGVPLELFEAALEAVKATAGVTMDSDLDPSALERLITKYKQIIEGSGKPFPNTLEDQVAGAIEAVFRSWNNPRAIEYRKINNIPFDWGTAVTIQSMVFGNLNDKSATGVLFSRDPNSGENMIVGEFLVNAQGEDVVAGIRTPLPIFDLAEKMTQQLSDELVDCVVLLEKHYRDMQDIEFTIEDGKLYILQTRNGKRAAAAAFKIAYDLVEEGVIDQETAVSRINQEQLFALMSDSIDPSFAGKPDVIGIPAGGGVVSGVAVFSSEDAVNCKKPCILVTKETNPDDIAGMNAAVGILTATGGLTSHAAVVARGMNKSCVVGTTGMAVVGATATVQLDGNIMTFSSGDQITIDGSTGKVWVKKDVPIVAGGMSAEADKILSWSKSPDTPVRITFDSSATVDDMKAMLKSVSASILYIDTALLEGFPSSHDELTANMTALGAALEGETRKIILDLQSYNDVLPASDFTFCRMFGEDYPGGVVAKKKASLIVNEWPKSVLPLLQVKQGVASATVATKILRDAGIAVFGNVSTFEDLLSANGPVEVTPFVIEKVFGSPEAYQAACALIEKSTGKKLSGDIIPPSYWYQFNGKAA